MHLGKGDSGNVRERKEAMDQETYRNVRRAWIWLCISSFIIGFFGRGILEELRTPAKEVESGGVVTKKNGPADAVGGPIRRSTAEHHVRWWHQGLQPGSRQLCVRQCLRNATEGHGRGLVYRHGSCALPDGHGFITSHPEVVKLNEGEVFTFVNQREAADSLTLPVFGDERGSRGAKAT
jgi:hypothetical protein